MKYRVIEQKTLYYIQKKVGIIFKKWVFINIEGGTINYNHDWEDAQPIQFQTEEDAINYMESLAHPPQCSDIRICAWID